MGEGGRRKPNVMAKWVEGARVLLWNRGAREGDSEDVLLN